MNRVLVPLLAIAVAVPVVAQMPQGRKAAQPMTKAEVEARVKERFARMDANRDGAVTREEIDAARAAHRAERQDRRFDVLDADRNGVISRAEFDAVEPADHTGETDGAAGRAGREQIPQTRRGGGFRHPSILAGTPGLSNLSYSVMRAPRHPCGLTHRDAVRHNQAHD